MVRVRVKLWPVLVLFWSRSMWTVRSNRICQL
jgi:hypothetical protein